MRTIYWLTVYTILIIVMLRLVRLPLESSWSLDIFMTYADQVITSMTNQFPIECREEVDEWQQNTTAKYQGYLYTRILCIKPCRTFLFWITAFTCSDNVIKKIYYLVKLWIIVLWRPKQCSQSWVVFCRKYNITNIALEKILHFSEWCTSVFFYIYSSKVK